MSAQRTCKYLKPNFTFELIQIQYTKSYDKQHIYTDSAQISKNSKLRKKVYSNAGKIQKMSSDSKKSGVYRQADTGVSVQPTSQGNININISITNSKKEEESYQKFSNVTISNPRTIPAPKGEIYKTSSYYIEIKLVILAFTRVPILESQF